VKGSWKAFPIPMKRKTTSKNISGMYRLTARETRMLTAKEKIMVTEQEYVEPSESMKAFLSGYCYAGICWVCGARLKEKGATVCPGGAHKSKDRKEEE